MCNIFQVCELKKQIRESSSLSTGRHTLHQIVFRKLAVAYSSALQGLQVIETAVELQMYNCKTTSQHDVLSVKVTSILNSEMSLHT